MCIQSRHDEDTDAPKPFHVDLLSMNPIPEVG
jgi:hypothetical protein